MAGAFVMSLFRKKKRYNRQLNLRNYLPLRTTVNCVMLNIFKKLSNARCSAKSEFEWRKVYGKCIQ